MDWSICNCVCWVHPIEEASDAVLCWIKIKVDLLLKPNDDVVKLVRVGIDEIDTHVPERFTRSELEAALGMQR